METYTDRLFCSGRTVNRRANLALKPEFSLFVELRGWGGSDLGSGGGDEKSSVNFRAFFITPAKTVKLVTWKGKSPVRIKSLNMSSFSKKSGQDYHF